MGHREAIAVIEDRDQLLYTARPQLDARFKPRKMASSPRPMADACKDLNGNDQEVVVIPKLRFTPPTAPTASDVGINTASLTWAAIALAEYEPPQEDGQLPEYSVEYLLEYQEGSLENGSAPANGTPQNGKAPRTRGEAWKVLYRGSELEHKVTTLRPGRCYLFQIRCLPRVLLDNFELVPTPPSPPTEVVTIPTPPHELQPPALSNRARNALKLKWMPPEETGGLPILLYTLFMKPAPPGHNALPDCDGFVVVYSGEERVYRISGLRPGMRFTFRVQGANKLGSSPHSLCSVFTTQASVPGVITSMHEDGRTENSVSFRWRAPEDNGAAITRYVMEMDDGARDGFRLVYSGAAPACSIPGLRSGLAYRFRVLAENSEGRGNWSAPFMASTAASTPSSPGTPTVIGTNRTSASLTWNPPEDDGGSMVELYELDLLPKSAVAVEQQGRDWRTVFRGPSCGGQAPNLLPGCAYMCRVRAINSAGPGPYSAAVEVQAAADSPYPPPAPEATAATSHSVAVAWKPPPHDGGAPITGYRLEAALTHPASSTLHPSASYNPLDTSPPTYRCVYSGPERVVIVEDLPAGAHFLLRVSATNAQGGSAWSATTLATTRPALPLQPPAAAITATTSSSVSLQWQAPDCQGSAVTGYQVEAAPVEAHCTSPSTSSQAAAGDPSATSTAPATTAAPHGPRYTVIYRGAALHCEAKGLEPHQEYAFRVRATNAVGSGPWSPDAKATTQPAAPTAPLDLHVTDATSSTLTLAWAPPAAHHGCPVTAYLLETAHPPARAPPKSSSASSTSSAAAHPPTWTRAWQGPELTTTLPSLKPGRTYTFRVRALNARGASPPSDPTTAATRPAPPGPPAPPAVSQRTATSLRAKWAFPADDNGAPVEHCVLELAGVDGAFRPVYRGPETTHKLTALQPLTQYTLRVAAVNAAGHGAWSPEETVVTTTLPPLPPQDVDAAAAEEEAAEGPAAVLTVRWDPPVAAPQCAKVLMYEVEAAEEGGEGRSWRATPGGGEGECALRGLPTGTPVAVRMRAVGADGAGHSGWTAPVRVQTPGRRVVAAAASATGEGDDGDAGGAAAARKRGKGKAKGKAARLTADSDDSSSATAGGPATGKGPRPAGAAAKAAAAKVPPKRKALLTAKQAHSLRRFLVNVTLGSLVAFIAWLVWEEAVKKPAGPAGYAGPAYHLD